MQLSRAAVSCVVLAVVALAAAAAGVAARTELHEAVAADLTEPTWMRAEYADSESVNKPLTAEQRFRQELYLELHPERVVKPEAVKIRFLQDGVTLDQAQAQEQEQGADAETQTDAEAETETQADAEADTESEAESQAEGEAQAETESGAEAESEAESESDAQADAESEEAAASMRPLDNAEAEEEAADARYRMDSVLHADMPLPVPLPNANANAAHTQVAATMDTARFAQQSAMVAANTAAHQQQQAQALGGATAQQQAMMWSAEKQAALDAFLEADDMDEEDLDEAEDEDEDEDHDEDEAHDQEGESDEESGEQQMLEMRAEHAAVHERTRFGRGAAARMGMPDYERRAEDEEQMMGGAREYDSDAEDVSDLMAAQEEVDAHTGAGRMMARAPGHEHDQFGGDVRFARVHAPLPENKDSRLYYARSRRGEKIRRMIKRGEMLYRYAPELMSKVFDPARKVERPGVSPTFGQAMDGPLGPITPPPLGGAAKPKKGSVGPAFFQMNEHAHAQQHAEAAAREDGDEGESGGSSKPEKGAKGSKEWIAKKMAEIDSLIKNPYAQAEKYPQMYQHWDNYMYPMRNRPLPPRFYPYPQKGRNPISAFPPAAALFEAPPPQRGPLQTPNALFQNPRGVGGLQPLPAPFAPIGQPSAPSPYASPLGLARFPGGGMPQGPDAANNGVLGPKNHPVFSAHPLPLQKWYQKFLQPAEPPAMTKAPGAKGGDAEGEGASGGGGEGESDS